MVYYSALSSLGCCCCYMLYISCLSLIVEKKHNAAGACYAYISILAKVDGLNFILVAAAVAAAVVVVYLPLPLYDMSVHTFMQQLASSSYIARPVWRELKLSALAFTYHSKVA